MLSKAPHVVWSVLSMAAIVANGQDSQPLESTTFRGQELLVMPVPTDVENRTVVVGEFEIHMERRDDKVVYQARTPSKTVTQWAPQSDPSQRFVFDPNDHRFKRLMPSVRVWMDDFTKFEDVIKNAEASSGKAFPDLGYGIATFARSVNPVEKAQKIRSDPKVRAAEIMFESAPHVPL